jgi:flagellar hook-length control protein FliK
MTETPTPISLYLVFGAELAPAAQLRGGTSAFLALLAQQLPCGPEPATALRSARPPAPSAPLTDASFIPELAFARVQPSSSHRSAPERRLTRASTFSPAPFIPPLGLHPLAPEIPAAPPSLPIAANEPEPPAPAPTPVAMPQRPSVPHPRPPFPPHSLAQPISLSREAPFTTAPQQPLSAAEGIRDVTPPLPSREAPLTTAPQQPLSAAEDLPGPTLAGPPEPPPAHPKSAPAGLLQPAVSGPLMPPPARAEGLPITSHVLSARAPFPALGPPDPSRPPAPPHPSASGPAVDPRSENRTEIPPGSPPDEGPEAVLEFPPAGAQPPRPLAPRAFARTVGRLRTPVPPAQFELYTAFPAGHRPLGTPGPARLDASPPPVPSQTDHVRPLPRGAELPAEENTADAYAQGPPLPPVTRREPNEPIPASAARPQPALPDPVLAPADTAPAAPPPPRDAGPAGPAHTPPAVDLDAVQLLDQIHAGVRKAIHLTRVTVQLHPPDLGLLHIAVESRDGALAAHFHAAHPQLHSWLESSAPALRSHLADSGLAFNDVSFSTADHQPGGHWPGDTPEPPHPPDFHDRTPHHTPHPAPADVARHDGIANWLA